VSEPASGASRGRFLRVIWIVLGAYIVVTSLAGIGLGVLAWNGWLAILYGALGVSMGVESHAPRRSRSHLDLAITGVAPADRRPAPETAPAEMASTVREGAARTEDAVGKSRGSCERRGASKKWRPGDRDAHSTVQCEPNGRGRTTQAQGVRSTYPCLQDAGLRRTPAIHRCRLTTEITRRRRLVRTSRRLPHPQGDDCRRGASRNRGLLGPRSPEPYSLSARRRKQRSPCARHRSYMSASAVKELIRLSPSQFFGAYPVRRLGWATIRRSSAAD